jgi:F420-dependent oxidoreductase-like protein
MPTRAIPKRSISQRGTISICHLSDDGAKAGGPRDAPTHYDPSVRFGIQIETQFGFSFDDVRQIAKDAEQGGFEAMWVCDHFFLDANSTQKNCLEAWTLLAALTQTTRTLRLGTLVSCQSYRNPALLAKTAASLDHLSGGRMEFGIGAGWKEIEYRAYGYDFPQAGVRVDQLIETIEICKRMWTEEKATYHGKHYRIDDAQCAPKPVQKPLPMWIAGSKPRLMRIVAKHADAVNVGGFPSPERYAEVMRDLEAACAKAKRDPKTILRSQFFRIDPAPAEAIIEKLRPYAALGVSYVIPVFPYGKEREMVQLFAEKVIPAMRAA